ncbi:MAG TPA: VOC family protein [bacterium]|nr:VOC family protein [bacterium]
MKNPTPKKTSKKARAIGMNHVALEVGDIEAALDLYGRLFDFKLRGRNKGMAFIDLGDQFIALQQSAARRPDAGRHFGLVVDDADAVKRELDRAGKEVRRIGDYDFLDPWGNRIQIIEYSECQFSKTPAVLRGMKLEGLEKNQEALEELKEKRML